MAQVTVHNWDALDKEDLGPLIQRRYVLGEGLIQIIDAN